MAVKQLTQAEIDALLNQASSGEVQPSEVTVEKAKKYDFRTPKKFTKEQLKTLNGLYENYARILSSYFSSILRTYSEVSVASIEEQRYFEYNNALPDSALIGLVDFKPQDKRYNDGIMLVDMSTQLGYFMVDRLLGGSGDKFNLNREYTDIEISLLRNTFSKILDRLQESWRNYIDIHFSLNSIETNARLLQALGPEDIVVIIMMNVKIQNLSSTLNICIPAENLEEVIDTFNVKYTRSSKKIPLQDSEQKRKFIFESLVTSDLEIKAVFDDSQLLLSDILQLQVDDVIPLNKSLNSDIYISIDDVPWYSAKLGELKNKKAVKLNEMFNH